MTIEQELESINKCRAIHEEDAASELVIPLSALDGMVEKVAKSIDSFSLLQRKECIKLAQVAINAIKEGKITPEEMQANGYLFAAAPEMLKALKDAHPHIADDKLRAEIGSVIMKAEGN